MRSLVQRAQCTLAGAGPALAQLPRRGLAQPGRALSALGLVF